MVSTKAHINSSVDVRILKDVAFHRIQGLEEDRG